MRKEQSLKTVLKNIPKEEIFYSPELGTHVTDLNQISIPGLKYIKNFITPQESERLIKLIDSNDFVQEIKRRQQFYGKTYYHTKSDIKTLQPTKLEDENILTPTTLDISPFDFLIKRSIEFGLFGEDPNDYPDQVLVNEYTDNMGIRSHFEDKEAFGKVIVTISLISPLWMTLKYPEHVVNMCPNILKQTRVWMEPNSMLLMSEEVRYRWRHGITKAKFIIDPNKIEDLQVYNDLVRDNVEADVGDVFLKRDSEFRRISLTIRKLLDGRKKIEENSVGWIGKKLKKEEFEN
ncbi:hypothetical protein HK099_000742 [Clydaea vesicula]|uniref:Alpha-ketoglutarate-dependent dioxygenase AlkB-like domain-containing protein n=1 Tax=Clydaea vesicula TaxID=447962 RepID=A0AAD5U5M7_9FUNG|nr:hypothetical protein HK099_000742 [Clydaea vesicula]